jgi:hypothetical protein
MAMSAKLWMTFIPIVFVVLEDQLGQLLMGPIKQIAGAPFATRSVDCESADSKKSGHTEKEMARGVSIAE